MNTDKNNIPQETEAVEVNDTEKAVSKKKENKGFKAFITSRKAKHGSVAIAIVAVGIAIAIILNVICSLLVSKFPALSIDMTSNQVFELQQDTTDYVNHLEKDITINVLSTKDNFISNGSYFVQAEKLLTKIDAMSDHIKVEYVSLNENPAFSADYPDVDWTMNNHVFLVTCGNQYRMLDIEECFNYDEETLYYSGSYNFTGSKVEQALVTAMLNVTTENKTVIDFITGYGEVDYTVVKEILEKNAYQVNEVKIATSDLDQEAKIAVIFAPNRDYDYEAVNKLRAWLENEGEYGRSIIYVANIDTMSTPNLDEFLNEWGMKTINGIVYETNPNYLISNNVYVSLVDYNGVFMDGLKNSSIPCASSSSKGIEITDESIAVPVLTTSDMAGVRPYESAQDANFDYQSAITGKPVNVAVKGTKTNTEDVQSNVVMFGSYEMFGESLMSYNSFNNSAFFMNTVNTLADRDDLGITIEGKSMDNPTLGIDLAAQNTLMVIFVIILPIATLAAGLVIWLRRRNK